MMKTILTALFIFTILGTAEAQPDAAKPEPVRVASGRGFSYPYYYYVPSELRSAGSAKQKQTILVLPNNTGKLDDALDVHEADVKRRMAQASAISSALKVIVLMPVFPRPKTDWQIYTHALDRDAMVTGKKEYARFDLQLIAMIDDARGRLREEGIDSDKRVLINGFSASGMFTNRFTFLHPDRVKAAAIGSPGGWPIAPVAAYKEKRLRYPIGIADVKTVAGRTIDLDQLRKVPLFIFLGDKDENDSVVFGDSYEEVDKDLILSTFGQKPVDRWAIIESLYKEAGLNAEFRLYSDVAHTVSPQMRDDIRSFLEKHK